MRDEYPPFRLDMGQHEAVELAGDRLSVRLDG
jgi:hypothetical protein